MKRIITLIACMALLAIPISAQNAAKARQVLDKAAAKVSNKGGASARFKMSAGGQTTTGTIAIKGNKFRATTGDATVWFDGKTQWTYVKSTDEVNVSTPTEAQQAKMNPYKFITLYKSGYTMSMKTVGGQNEVHLTAQDKSRSIQQVYITVHPTTSLPTRVRLFTGGKWLDITVSDFKASAQSDASFKFNPKDYPHAEVVDLR